MPVHKRLIPFFTGAHSALLAAYERSMGSSGSCTGSVREHGIREALKHTLPPIARIHDGEVIDAYGRMTGQLDGIVVHASGPALAGSEYEPRVVLAEGVLAVIESKSHVAEKWDEVKATWGRVLSIRRSYDPQAAAWLRQVEPHPADAAIPFIAVGYKGWQTREKLTEKAVELFNMFPEMERQAGRAPPIHVFQLDPPGFGVVVWREGPPQCNSGLCEPWRVMAQLWSVITFNAQRFQVLPLDFAGYIKPDVT